MALLLQDEDLEALDVALSFVDTCTASPVDSTRASLSDSAPHSETELSPAASEDDAMQLGEELNELLMSTLLPSASDMMIEFQPPTPQYVLPTPLAPLTTNISASDAAELKENGRMRGGCRAAQCRTAVPANKKPKRVKVNPNRARDERKHELAYLRNKVRQMETELGELHRRHRLGSTAGLITASHTGFYKQRTPALTLAASDSSSITNLPPYWRDVAARQKLRREKAERENARLKLVLEGQIKLARSMETLLQKRARQQVSECEGCVGGKDGSQGSTLDFLADKQTFDALIASVEAAYRELDEVFAINGLQGCETSRRDARMREGANGMYLDISSNKVLPYSVQTVGAAVWNHFKGTNKHRGNYYDKYVKNMGTAADTVIEDFKMEFIGKSTRADFRVKQVHRRFMESDREAVVWVTSVHSLDEGKSRPFAGLGFTEKGYVVIKTPTSPTLVSGGYSVLQMCSIVVPQKADRCAQDATTVGAFTEFALNVIVANATVSQEMIENVLLDQALDYST